MRRNVIQVGLPLLLAMVATTAGCPEANQPQNDASIHNFNDAGLPDAGDAVVDANVNAPRCSDGVDNDGDGLVDYPDDPGCDDANDGDESNPAFCGLDDLGEMILIRNLPPTWHLVQNTEYGWDHHQGSCGGADAPEMVFQLTVTEAIDGLRISTVGDPTLLDSVVYVRKDVCDGTDVLELGCDAPSGELGATVEIMDPEIGEYFIFVDGGSSGAAGQFLLEVRGLIPEGGACDPNSEAMVCAKGLICAGDPTVCKVPLCNDGLDNDGDGIIDFPLEPGCTSDLDDSEDDACPGLGCPECADGIDNDGDGFTDYPDDPGCGHAGDPIELDACMTGLDLLPLPASGVATGSIVMAEGSHTQGSCTQYSSGPETVFPLNLPFGALEVSLEMQTSFTYPVLYVRQDECSSGDEVGCIFNWNYTQELRLLDLAPGTYFIFADTSEVYQDDQFTLRVSVLLPVGAVCDPTSPLGQCGPGGTCSNAGGAGYFCEPSGCNDGIDNDGDGYTDWPNDPGCADVSDDDESDNCVQGTQNDCPACFNEVDDDGDGLTDFPADPGCASAGDVNEINECLPGLVVEIVDSGTETGTLEQAAQSYIQPTCNSWTYGEDVWALDLPYGAGLVEVSLSSMDLDLVLYLRRGDCGTAPDEQCKQTYGGGGNPPAQATLTNLAPGEKVFVFADTSYVWNNVSGTYTLQFNVGLPRDAPCEIGNPLKGCAVGAVCQDTGGGAYACVGTLCNDGEDNDLDGLIDYPNDPGCNSVSDNNETDPAVMPLCHDGLDNDGDGFTDYPDDPGCTSAADNNELDECGTGLMVADIGQTGTGSGLPTGANLHEGSCNYAGYPEDVYLLRLAQPVTQVRALVTSDSNMQPVLFVRQGDCESSSAEVACQVAGSPSWTSAEVTLNNVAAGNLYFFVDSSWSNVWAQYALEVEVTLTSGGQCDPDSPVFLCPSGTICTDTGTEWVCE